MPLTQEEKKRLLAMARRAITERLLGRTYHPENPAPGGALAERCGVFVTLHKKGRLRGCIGNFLSDRPLHENTAEMAVAAAFTDPRFPPLSAEELDEIDIEISVISPLREIEDVEEIEVGRHGIYITNGRARGVLLPQVAVEQGYDRYAFLDQTCLKAGLEPGCWRRDDIRIFVFEAEVFGEKDLKPGGQESS